MNKKVVLIIFSFFSSILINDCFSQSLSSSKDSYYQDDFFLNETIVINFSDGPGNAKDWIGIYDGDRLPNNGAALIWSYVDGTEDGNTGKKSGTIEYDKVLQPGSYKAYFLENNGYKILATTSFVVTDEVVENKVPVAAGQSVNVDEDGSVSITLTGSDEDGDDLSFAVLSQPKNGTLSGAAPALTYSPKANYSGSDSFTFKANDGQADSNTATVAIRVIKKSTLPEGVYFEEDFDGLTLGAFESDSEKDGDGTDWTAQGPAGWVMRKGEGHGPTEGGEAVKEFDGWTFVDPASWNATAGQDRGVFSKGKGVIAVADSDEYDDKADAAFDASLETPSIDISGAVANRLILIYDSSWRKEPQLGSVRVI